MLAFISPGNQLWLRSLFFFSLRRSGTFMGFFLVIQAEIASSAKWEKWRLIWEAGTARPHRSDCPCTPEIVLHAWEASPRSALRLLALHELQEEGFMSWAGLTHNKQVAYLCFKQTALSQWKACVSPALHCPAQTITSAWITALNHREQDSVLLHHTIYTPLSPESPALPLVFNPAAILVGATLPLTATELSVCVFLLCYFSLRFPFLQLVCLPVLWFIMYRNVAILLLLPTSFEKYCADDNWQGNNQCKPLTTIRSLQNGICTLCIILLKKRGTEKTCCELCLKHLVPLYTNIAASCR